MEGNTPGYIPLFVWDITMNNLSDEHGWAFFTGA